MKEQDTRSKWVQVLARHGEKFALAAVLLFVVGYTAFALAIAEEDPDIRGTKEILDPAKDFLANPKPVEPPGPARDYVAQSLGPWIEITDVSKLPKYVDYAGDYMPIVTGPPPPPPPPPPLIIVPSVNLAAPAVTLRRIEVTWEVNPVPEKAIAAPLTRIVLQRREGDGEWKPVAELGKDSTSYVDTAVAPKRPYSYRVVPFFKHKRFGPDEFCGKTAGPATVVSAAVFRYQIAGTNPPAFATFKVSKHEPGIGWVQGSFYVRPGQKIGSEQAVRVEGSTRPVKIDFSSQARLGSVESVKTKLERIVCRKRARNMGLVCVEEKESRVFSVTQVTYVDDVGETVVVDTKKPAFEDQRCPEHGATFLLKKADELWKGDREGARAIYAELLKEFGTTTAVRGDLERIKARSE